MEIWKSLTCIPSRDIGKSSRGAATSRWLKDLGKQPSKSSSSWFIFESISHSDCSRSHLELEPSESERLSSDSSHSQIVSELRNAPDESLRGFGRGACDSRKFTSRVAWSRAINFSTFVAPAKGRRE